MINLLPPQEKQKILMIKKQKLAVILGIIVLVSLVCMVLVLLSIKFYLLADTNYQKSILEMAISDNQASDFTENSSIIKKYNALLLQLDSFYAKEIYFNEVFKIITDISNVSGLRLTNFLVTRNSESSIRVALSGTSNTRENLLAFKKNIEENEKIINYGFSPESWVSPKNANFSLTFEINYNEK